MFYTGLVFLFDWLLIKVFEVELVKSILITAIVALLVGLLIEGVPTLKNPWNRP